MVTRPKSDVIFILSIDTEEEWDWTGPFPKNNCSVENIQQLPKFQTFCEKLNIRPTYFVDYAVADNLDAADTLKSILEKKQCEIGAHLHPWCNPPYFGESGERESHVINLPISQVEQKLDALVEILCKRLNVIPNSFRTGRWGIDSKILQLLVTKGFQVDSSMYPFYKNKYFNNEMVKLVPYWPDYNNPIDQGPQRNIVELPVTVGFNRSNYSTMLKLYNVVSLPIFNTLRLVGILWHTRILRKLYLSPESTSGNDMKTLINSSLKNRNPVIHMYLHSSSLIDGPTGFTHQQNSFDIICDNIKQAIDYTCQKANIKFCTISEAASILKQRENNTEY
jgi:hypothetical protein